MPSYLHIQSIKDEKDPTLIGLELVHISISLIGLNIRFAREVLINHNVCDLPLNI